MDSFYELAHQGEIKPYSLNNVCVRPMVPDVSMLHENSEKSAQAYRRSDEHLSYNAWKCMHVAQKNPQIPPSNVRTDNSPRTPIQVSNSILRKQVRFQSPTLKQQNENSSIRGNNVFESSEVFGKAFHNARNDGPKKNVFESSEVFGKAFHNARNDGPKKISDFENIYLANIPNRKLDLSLLDPPLPTGKKVLVNCSKFAELEKKIDTPVYDILNYKSPIFKKTDEFHSSFNANTDDVSAQISSSKNNHGFEDYFIDTTNNSPHISSNRNQINSPSRRTIHYRNQPTQNCKDNEIRNRHNLREQISNIPEETNVSCVQSTALVPSNNSDISDQPTVRDLLKIIQQQNEQLLILQKQVATLIDNQQTQQKAIENRQTEKVINEPATFQVFDKDKFCPKNPMTANKFNIDVMTSFEVSIRPQQKPNGRPLDGGYQEVKIQEITEDFDCNMQLKEMKKRTDQFIGVDQAKAQTNELSLMLSEPLQLQEGRISPDQSVHVDMHDYSSDGDSDSNDSSDLGWTIYNNVMGQVNNILTKANVTKMDQMGAQHTNNDKIRSKTMKQVKEATLRHLQSIGVHVPMDDDSSDSLRTENSALGLDYSPTEVSFAVQQLLMKYLPSEHLAKLANIPQDTQSGGNLAYSHKRNKKGAKATLVSRRPEFSFATVQYMKKYNLMASLDDEGAKIQTPQTINNTRTNQHKFLDITALKQQPKLL